jgi:type IV pilus assembly protein PilB
VTGPTGSRQDDHALRRARQAERHRDTKILTAEDPVEYDIDGLMPVPGERGSGPDLRAGRCDAFLRQDPDVILVGEIRDLETAADRGAGVADRPPGALARSTPTTRRARSSRLVDLGSSPSSSPPPSRASSPSDWSARCARSARKPYTPKEEELMELSTDPRHGAAARTSSAGEGAEQLQQQPATTGEWPSSRS